MVSPAAPGLFFAFAATALLLFGECCFPLPNLAMLIPAASITPPAWRQVNFLTATAGGTESLFGMLGECISGGACTKRAVGYNLVLNGATSVT